MVDNNSFINTETGGGLGEDTRVFVPPVYARLRFVRRDVRPSSRCRFDTVYANFLFESHIAENHPTPR